MEQRAAEQHGTQDEDVPVIYLHEIKRQYVQGEQPLVILDGAKLALWAGQSVALGRLGLRQVNAAPYRRPARNARRGRGLCRPARRPRN